MPTIATSLDSYLMIVDFFYFSSNINALTRGAPGSNKQCGAYEIFRLFYATLMSIFSFAK